jgi:hypothetical protein
MPGRFVFMVVIGLLRKGTVSTKSNNPIDFTLVESGAFAHVTAQNEVR